MSNSNETAIRPCDILIPKDKSCHEQWAVIACDQYTSQPEYWKNVEEITKGSPSSLDIIFPEVYLEYGDMDKRISSINNIMGDYLNSSFFKTINNGFVLTERFLPGGAVRKGLIAAFDLEHYDYSPNADSLIRATEGTVLDRLPPRVKIRSNAPLELPHIMILIDDPDKTVIEPLFNNNLNKIYNFDLMLYSGHLNGYEITDSEIISSVNKSLLNLKNSSSDEFPLLYAVGDGNHSLASAKLHWKNIKATLTSEEASVHPARFALAELVNIHDESLVFESINRVCFDVDPETFLNEFKKYYLKQPETEIIHKIKYTYKDVSGEIDIPNCSHSLEIGTLQIFIDHASSSGLFNGMKIDYIHGDDVVTELSASENSIGFILPAMHKSQLFPSIASSGVLPRKTFSMGEAFEKRFYFECRKIIK